jgi:hypothetical protein
MRRNRQTVGRGIRWAWPVGILTIAALAALWWFAPGPADRAVSSGTHRASATPRGRKSVAMAPESALPGPVAPASKPDVPAAENAPESADEQMSMGWEAVDLEEVRKAMPDNLYWKRSMPTKDPKVEEERDAERERWNVEYGKILSGTASEQEIRAYYDYQAKLNGDSIEFTTYLLDHYREQLPERDVGLLELASRLHRARLEEIPRKFEEALERKHKQDAAREAWRAGETDFGAADSNAE